MDNDKEIPEYFVGLLRRPACTKFLKILQERVRNKSKIRKDNEQERLHNLDEDELGVIKYVAGYTLYKTSECKGLGSCFWFFDKCRTDGIS